MIGATTHSTCTVPKLFGGILWSLFEPPENPLSLFHGTVFLRFSRNPPEVHMEVLVWPKKKDTDEDYGALCLRFSEHMCTDICEFLSGLPNAGNTQTVRNLCLYFLKSVSITTMTTRTSLLRSSRKRYIVHLRPSAGIYKTPCESIHEGICFCSLKPPRSDL